MFVAGEKMILMQKIHQKFWEKEGFVMNITIIRIIFLHKVIFMEVSIEIYIFIWLHIQDEADVYKWHISRECGCWSCCAGTGHTQSLRGHDRFPTRTLYASAVEV